MKKVFILATAAIVALASCAKTQVVYNGQPEEIAFKQIAGPMTKAELVALTENMGVFAWTVISPEVYFDNIQFNETGGIWKAAPSKFYPIQGELDFAYYSPYALDWTFNGSTTLTSPALPDIKNTDVLYGKTIATSAKKAEALTVELAHALAKVTVNVTTDEASKGHITITEVTLSDTHLGGTLTVTYDDKDADNAVWAADAASSLTWDSDRILTSTENLPYGQNYIIADYGSGTTYEQGTLTVSYSMDIDGAGAGTDRYEGTATFDLSKDGSKAYWNMGNNYIYNIKATLTEIIFDADVEKFVDTPAAGTPVEL